MSDCPEFIKYCEKLKWPLEFVIISAILCLFVVILGIIVLYLLLMSKKYIKRKPHIIILSLLASTALVRICWWPMNYVRFKDNSPPAIAIQVLNRIALLGNYLSQSIYV